MKTALILSGALGLAPATFAAFSYPGCADLAETDFTAETLVAHSSNPETQEPMKLAFDMDAQGNVDVYFTQRYGQLRKYRALTKDVVDLANFAKYPGFPTSFSGGSDGLIGIAMDPAFKTDHWIYLYISTSTDWRVSRFTLNGETLDMTSEKIVIKIPQKPLSQHPGGALQFDKFGNLWISVGDNHLEWPAANTNDLRGKILRIHPTADGSYTIPAGNLFPVGQYPADKTRPEIYIMGNRNPYTLTLDSVRNAVTWGDVGPDAGAITEEHDYATAPQNGGWPFWSGDQVSQGKNGGTPDKPTNTDASNTGLTNLPPAIPGFDNYKESCAITGPVYWYDPASPSKVKMPPHFHGMWFVSDFSHFSVQALTLDDKGTKILSRQPIFTSKQLNGILDFQTGPDGAFYFVNYAGYRDFTSTTGLVRIVYNGKCTAATVNTLPKPQWAERAIQMRGTAVAIVSEGPHSLEVRTLSGRVLMSKRGTGAAEYDLASIKNPGLSLVTVTTSQGSFAWKIVR